MFHGARIQIFLIILKLQNTVKQLDVIVSAGRDASKPLATHQSARHQVFVSTRFVDEFYGMRSAAGLCESFLSDIVQIAKLRRQDAFLAVVLKYASYKLELDVITASYKYLTEFSAKLYIPHPLTSKNLNTSLWWDCIYSFFAVIFSPFIFFQPVVSSSKFDH